MPYKYPMSIRQTLVTQVEAFLVRSGMSERQLGMRVANDHKLIQRLREGRLSLSRIERIEAFISDERDAVIDFASPPAPEEAAE